MAEERLAAADPVEAVKIPAPEFGEFLDRFRREGSAAARLSHPVIVPVNKVGEARGRHYRVMKYIEGTGAATLGAGFWAGPLAGCGERRDGLGGPGASVSSVG